MEFGLNVFTMLIGSYSTILLHNDRSPKYYAFGVAEYLGYRGDLNDSDAILKFLQDQSSYDILRATTLFKVDCTL